MKVAPEAITVTEWEQWTAMRFPETGDYIVPGALQPVHIDREKDNRPLRRPERLDAPSRLGRERLLGS